MKLAAVSGAPQFCTCCDRPLNPERIEWLELNQRSGDYTALEGECPAGESQGWFPFGVACARRTLRSSAP